mmetsp:Transcript_34904/g.66670  ORF Transcript_34904/g.66670 Transcript_34904/m.66670 type:complete len:264 (+) Transcript_34904:642-1433(+)
MLRGSTIELLDQERADHVHQGQVLVGYVAHDPQPPLPRLDACGIQRLVEHNVAHGDVLHFAVRPSFTNTADGGPVAVEEVASLHEHVARPFLHRAVVVARVHGAAGHHHPRGVHEADPVCVLGVQRGVDVQVLETQAVAIYGYDVVEGRVDEAHVGHHHPRASHHLEQHGCEHVGALAAQVPPRPAAAVHRARPTDGHVVHPVQHDEVQAHALELARHLPHSPGGGTSGGHLPRSPGGKASSGLGHEAVGEHVLGGGRAGHHR